MASRITMVVAWMCVGCIYGAPTTEVAEPEPKNQCAANKYCQGEKLKNTVIGDHYIQCDSVPEPRDSCCLPQEKHIVCYNIRVDGQFLNFDQADTSKATNFDALCETILAAKKQTPGSYSKVTLDRSKGGYIIFNNNEEFEQLDIPSSESIKDLACGMDGWFPGKPNTLPATTTTPLPNKRPTTTTTVKPKKGKKKPNVVVEN